MSPHYIGVDLGGTNVRAGLVQDCELTRIEAKAIRSRGTEAEVFEDLCYVIDQVITPNVKGLGVGVPSLIEASSGTILDTTNIPSWKQVPLRQRLEAKYKIPVRIDNDANCFTLGEKDFGHGRGVQNFVGLIIGTGLGAGVISRGHLHSGTDCGAGEFGLIPYRDSIIEHYASGQFFTRFNTHGAELAERAVKRDPEALKIFAEYGEHLGHAIKTILYALAPEMIVFGGSVSRSFEHFAPSLNKSLESFAYPSVVKRLQFKISDLENAGILGAAGLVADAAETQPVTPSGQPCF